MGLAERFKDKLNNKDIVQQKEAEQKLNNNNIQFISKPVEIISKQIAPVKTILEEQESIIFENESVVQDNSQVIEQLKSKLLAKISKTPYWEEYSTEVKKSMVRKYIDRKLFMEQTPNTDKEQIIQDVITNGII